MSNGWAIWNSIKWLAHMRSLPAKILTSVEATPAVKPAMDSINVFETFCASSLMAQRGGEMVAMIDSSWYIKLQRIL